MSGATPTGFATCWVDCLNGNNADGGIIRMTHSDTTKANGLSATELAEGDLQVFSPIDGELIGRLSIHTVADTRGMVEDACAAFAVWRNVPAPRRGDRKSVV